MHICIKIKRDSTRLKYLNDCVVDTNACIKIKNKTNFVCAYYKDEFKKNKIWR